MCPTKAASFRRDVVHTLHGYREKTSIYMGSCKGAMLQSWLLLNKTPRRLERHSFPFVRPCLISFPKTKVRTWTDGETPKGSRIVLVSRRVTVRFLVAGVQKSCIRWYDKYPRYFCRGVHTSKVVVWDFWTINRMKILMVPSVHLYTLHLQGLRSIGSKKA